MVKAVGFCIQIENHNHRLLYGGIFLGVAILSLFTLLLYLFTPAPSLMVLKVISLALWAFMWLFLLPFALWLVAKRLKTKRDIRKTVERELASGK